MATVSVKTNKHATDQTVSAARKGTIIWGKTARKISATRAAKIKKSVKGKERTTPMSVRVTIVENAP